MVPLASRRIVGLTVIDPEVPAKECCYVAVTRHAILELEHIMALILEHQIAHVAAKCSEACDQISRLAFDDARIVAPLDDQQWAMQCIDVHGWRTLGQMCAIGDRIADRDLEIGLPCRGDTFKE